VTHLWELFGQAALALAVVHGAYLCFGLVRWAVTDPRGFGAKLCGELALFFALLAVLWAAVVGERHGWW
jgi:hypothetical protein